MANMSYCRFENTSIDLSDCVYALENEGLSELSESEREAAADMYNLCKEYVELYENNL